EDTSVATRDSLLQRGGSRRAPSVHVRAMSKEGAHDIGPPILDSILESAADLVSRSDADSVVEQALDGTDVAPFGCIYQSPLAWATRPPVSLPTRHMKE